MNPCGYDLLFQVTSRRYARGSLVVTTNKPYKQWASIFNNDRTIASAVPTACSTTPEPSSSRGQATG